MLKAEFGGVQCQPGGATFIGDRLTWKRSTVDLVTAQRMSGFRQVNADLVRPPGFQPAFDDGVALQSLDWLDVGNGPLAEFAVLCTTAPPVSPVGDEI